MTFPGECTLLGTKRPVARYIQGQANHRGEVLFIGGIRVCVCVCVCTHGVWIDDLVECVRCVCVPMVFGERILLSV